MTRNHCDQMGRFLEFLGNKLDFKSSPNVCVKTIAIYVKLVRLLFRQLSENLGYFLFQHLVTLDATQIPFPRNNLNVSN